MRKSDMFVLSVITLLNLNFNAVTTLSIKETSDPDLGQSVLFPSVIFNDCSIASFESCLTTIREVTADPNLSFPITKSELNLACRKLRVGDTCADNHMKNCTNKNQKMLFSDIVGGTKTVLGWLCVPGQYQEDYLRHSKCFRDVSMSEHKCLPVIRKVQSIDKDLRLVSDIDTELKTFCCAMKESVDCQLEYVRRDCGQRAVLFLDKYLSQISSQLMADHCATYTHSDGCALNAHVQQSSAIRSSDADLKLILVLQLLSFY